MGKLWIQCRMGLCSAKGAGASGNIQLCVDPKTCADREAPHLQSSLQQITVRGPLLIIPTPGDPETNGQTCLHGIAIEMAIFMALTYLLV